MTGELDKDLLERIKHNKEILAIVDEESSLEFEHAKAVVCPFYKDGGYHRCKMCNQDDITLGECKEEYLEKIEITPQSKWTASFGTKQPIRREKAVKEHGFGMFCDSCYFSDNCPEFAKNHTCAIDFGESISTEPKDVIDYLITLQNSRIKRSELAELVDGGIPDQNLSSEMDRMTNLLGMKSNLNSDKFSLRIEGQATGNGGGILAQLFGGGNKPAPQAIEEGVAEEIIEIPVLTPEKIEKMKNPEFEDVEEKPKSKKR